ncbi:MAG: nitroreductase family protein [Chloroflexota bacterium]|nr:nitroreductase family protein [Chloroflexota bacterium]
MEFQDVVRKRKMVRTFEDRPIDPAVLERIIANAQRAPSAGFSQGWAFLVLNGKDETERYWNTTMTRERRTDFGWPGMFNAASLIVCLSNKSQYIARYALPDKGWVDRDEKRWPVPFWDIDAGMAALLILQTAVDAGLGAVFFGIPDQSGFRAAFGVPDDYTAVGTVAIGHQAATDRPSPSLKTVGRKPASDVVHRGRWLVR